MRRLLLTARLGLVIAMTSAASMFVATSGAQAVVVDMNPSVSGQASVPYDPSAVGDYYGVALVPAEQTNPASVPGIPTVTSGAPCVDPALSSDLLLPNTGLCSHGGPVMHKNETFALTWGPNPHTYWPTTQRYLEQFLSDVATGSGALSSPYAVTSQYTDATGRAANASLYGGGCVDAGSLGGATCELGATNGQPPGNDYPASGCPVTGTNEFSQLRGGVAGTAANDVCLTDAQLRSELTTMISQTGLLAHTQPGYTPVVVLLTPPGVEVCLDAAGTLCSATAYSGAHAQFCSYHAQVDVSGTEFAYVVQPWTAQWGSPPTGCVEPDTTQIPQNPDVQVAQTDAGAQLVSPLSQGQIAAIVNPGLNGWFALDGSEINDNGCIPLSSGDDNVTVASSPYFLQREFNNAGVIETSPNTLECAPNVNLTPTFVLPSAINRGDVVEFDGSTTISSLIVPRANYSWSFGDGTASAVGPSVEHTYANGGSYKVTLTVTDRGGNVASLTQTLTVLGPPAKPPPAIHVPSTLQAHLQLMPQGLRTVLRAGLSLRVTSNQAADGFATISISRATARRAHIGTGHGATVVVGRGTLSGVKAGTIDLHLRLARGMARKLERLRYVTLTVRLALDAAGGAHAAVDAAGRY